jgi:pilus assembly protein CpaB
MRAIILIVITVVAILAGIVSLQLSKPAPEPQPVASSPVVIQDNSRSENLKTANVLVAKVAIPVGTKLDESMVDIQPWPEHLLLEGFILSQGTGGSEVIGKVARSSIQAREPFFQSKLANENDPGFLAATLPAGKRAITIATDTVSGIAGYVFPGDRVDLVFTHNVFRDIDPKYPGSKPVVSEVLVPNARVLAVNLRDATPPGTTPPSAAPTNVTLEVTDEDAQRVRLAEKIGTIALSLRSIKDDNLDLPNPTKITQLSHVSMGSNIKAVLPKVEGDASVLVIRGPGQSGGDISTSRVVNGVVVESDRKTAPTGNDLGGALFGGLFGGLMGAAMSSGVADEAGQSGVGAER